ncbi:BT4734/BF3469 family protein [Dysgonomonas macrotermitis]|nr:BT4734/BF3469 family protein [Dysgonomonas macrotermitis]
MDILNKKCSFFSDNKSTTAEKEITLRDFLYYPDTKKLVEEYRRTGDKLIKDKLPCATISGICVGGRKDSNMRLNGVVAIDLDKKANPHITNLEDLKNYTHHIPYVAACAHSAGGKGYYILIPIAYPDRHKEQYISICDDFERCGITIDRLCSNPSRLRFISSDDEPYINENATVYTRLPPNTEKPKKVKSNSQVTETDKANIKKCVDYICGELINIVESYEDWFAVGCSLASCLGEDGREFFHAISSMSGKYDYSECDKKYNECLKANHTNIGRFFNMCKKYNIEYKNL